MPGYVIDAVLQFVRRMHAQGTVDARPIRLDGFLRSEIGALVPAITGEWPGLLVCALSGHNNEPAHEINAERATRYRNLVDAKGHESGFLLFVPHGQTVESSLDEPAFLVVNRANVFRHALAHRRSALGLTYSDLQAIRDAARFKQPEQILAFLDQRDPMSSKFAPTASHDYLGLLADSSLAGSWSDVMSRLQLNAQATDILIRAGASASRTLDDLTSKVGLDAGQAGKGVLELQRWWRAGRTGAAPSALDFKSWPIAPAQEVEIRWEEDLSRAPNAGFKVANDRTEVETPEGTSTVEWTIVHKTPATRFELELVEDTSREVVKVIGKTKASRRKVRWSTVFRDDDVRERVKELNPPGELEGYLFRIRLKVFDGSRWIEQRDSDAFAVSFLPPPAIEPHGAAATAYHALYEFHTARAADPRVAGTGDSNDGSIAAVVLVAADGREKTAQLDVSRQMLGLERAVFDAPANLGSWRWGHGDDISPVLEPPDAQVVKAPPSPEAYLRARAGFLRVAARAGSVEALDFLEPTIRSAATEYVLATEKVLNSFIDHGRQQGAVPHADRQAVATLLATDTVVVKLHALDGGAAFRVLLVLPTHASVVAWLLDFADTIHSWTRGRFDPELKPAHAYPVASSHHNM